MPGLTKSELDILTLNINIALLRAIYINPLTLRRLKKACCYKAVNNKLNAWANANKEVVQLCIFKKQFKYTVLTNQDVVLNIPTNRCKRWNNVT